MAVQPIQLMIPMHQEALLQPLKANPWHFNTLPSCHPINRKLWRLFVEQHYKNDYYWFAGVGYL